MEPAHHTRHPEVDKSRQSACRPSSVHRALLFALSLTALLIVPPIPLHFVELIPRSRTALLLTNAAWIIPDYVFPFFLFNMHLGPLSSDNAARCYTATIWLLTLAYFLRTSNRLPSSWVLPYILLLIGAVTILQHTFLRALGLPFHPPFI